MPLQFSAPDLTNPVYAGAYVFGHGVAHCRRDALVVKVGVRVTRRNGYLLIQVIMTAT